MSLCQDRLPNLGPVDSNPLLDLPVEIRLQILYSIHYLDLKSFSECCRGLYGLFCAERDKILRDLVEDAFSSCYVEAHSLLKLHQQVETRNLFPLAMLRFNTKFEEELKSSTDCHTVLRALSNAEKKSMLAFHYKVVEPLAQRYFDFILSELELACKKSGSLHHGNTPYNFDQVSQPHIMRSRIIRAFYRYEHFCMIFGNSTMSGTVRRRFSSMFSGYELLYRHFELFEPWEIEEIGCVVVYAETLLDEFFDRVEAFVHPYSPGVGEWDLPVEPPGSIDLTDLQERNLARNGMTTHGVAFLLELTCLSSPPASNTNNLEEGVPEALLRLLKENLVLENRPYISTTTHSHRNAFSVIAQMDRRRIKGNDRDERCRRRAPLLFEDDSLSKPPIAWTELFDYDNNAVGIMIDRGLKRWGYVFWDKESFQETGATQLILEAKPHLLSGYAF